MHRLRAAGHGLGLVACCVMACTPDGGSTGMTPDAAVPVTEAGNDGPHPSMEGSATNDATAADTATGDAVVDRASEAEAAPSSSGGNDSGTTDATEDGGRDAAPASDAPVDVDGALDADAALDADGSPEGEASVDADADADGSEADAPDAAIDTFSIVASILGLNCAQCGADPNVAACFADPVECEALSAEPDDAGGPSAARRCADALVCTLTSQCVLPTSGPDPGPDYACYCGSVTSRDCSLAPQEGACRSAEEAAFYSTNSTVITSAFFDTNLPGGVVNYINLCLLQECPSECFP